MRGEEPVMNVEEMVQCENNPEDAITGLHPGHFSPSLVTISNTTHSINMFSAL